MQQSPNGYTFTLTIDARCRSCVMPRHIEKDLQDWDHLPDDGDIAEAIAQHVERRCSGCIEDCWVEEKRGHFGIFLTTTER
jgi:phage-related protein